MARRRRHTRAFKLSALARLERASDVAALAAELGIDRGLLYKWNRAFQRGGAAALRLPGERMAGERAAGSRPGAEAGPSGPAALAMETLAPSTRVRELERKVAQQALELDFFHAALQHFADRRRSGDGSGETGSTP